jgi:hypothetical protein
MNGEQQVVDLVAKSPRAREIGLGIIGSGRIGTLRARLAAGHPAVAGIAVSDLDPASAEKLAALVGGRSHGADNLAVIDDPAVTAVIVSTSEGEHLAPMLAALERGKPVLVEKPIALTVREADRVLAALKKSGGNVRVGYSRRGFVSDTFHCMLAPAGTPLAIVDRLAAASLSALKEPAFHDKLRTLGFEVIAHGPDGLRRRIAEEVPRFRDLIARAGIARV